MVFRDEASAEWFGKLGKNRQRRVVRRAENVVGGGVLERIARCGSVEELAEIEALVAGCTRMSEGTRRKVGKLIEAKIATLTHAVKHEA